tara:strand:+ start:757 stop:1947 length:1191 start_codon:yes stop_codon:yes gene_type:complete
MLKSEITDVRNNEKKEIDSNYLTSNKELEDYIIGKGDSLYIKFFPAIDLSGFYAVNDEGEIFLPRLNEVNVNGLRTSELQRLLNKKYAEFLISPEINVYVAIFREINVTVTGEVRYPGVYTFPSYKSPSIDNYAQSQLDLKFETKADKKSEKSTKNERLILPIDKFKNDNSSSNKIKTSNKLDPSYSTKVEMGNLTTISDVIRKAGGITSLTDLERIEVVRDVAIGDGGGKKRAIINLNTFLKQTDPSNDLRLFDGDRIFIPSLDNPNKAQVPKSVITGLSPRFISVKVFGRVANKGEFLLPLEGTLSDAIDITGPVKPLSGKVVLIRYNSDGTIERKKIDYSASAPRGSRRNPLIKEGDLITVTNSIFGKTTDVIKEITAPFVGIYSTKQLIEDF